MTDRQGGVSAAPWDSMNLGDHVGDQPGHVQANRALLAQAVGVRPVILQQVHGVSALMLNPESEDGAPADAAVVVAPGVAATILVADCLPVLLCDAAGQWVACAHAGWRGLAGAQGLGVLENLLHTAPLSGNVPDQILAWLGPCIGPQAFEVGSDVRSVFCEADPSAALFFKPGQPGKWWADLAQLARWRLMRLGVHRVFGNDSSPDWCTVAQGSRFFSHRRDSRVLGQTGRMAACIWLGD
jgi:YfiH family protein